VRSDDLAPVAYFGGRCNDAVCCCRPLCGANSAPWRRVALQPGVPRAHAAPQESEAWACLSPDALLAFRPVARRFASAILAQGRYESPCSRKATRSAARDQFPQCGDSESGGEAVQVWDGPGQNLLQGVPGGVAVIDRSSGQFLRLVERCAPLGGVPLQGRAVCWPSVIALDSR